MLKLLPLKWVFGLEINLPIIFLTWAIKITKHKTQIQYVKPNWLYGSLNLLTSKYTESLPTGPNVRLESVHMTYQMISHDWFVHEW